MKTLAIGFCILLSACGKTSPVQREKYQLDDGFVISCRWVKQNPCGFTFWDCLDGGMYACENNVIRLNK